MDFHSHEWKSICMSGWSRLLHPPSLWRYPWEKWLAPGGLPSRFSHGYRGGVTNPWAPR
jgi:hypothetical protein